MFDNTVRWKAVRGPVPWFTTSGSELEQPLWRQLGSSDQNIKCTWLFNNSASLDIWNNLCIRLFNITLSITARMKSSNLPREDWLNNVWHTHIAEYIEDHQPAAYKNKCSSSFCSDRELWNTLGNNNNQNTNKQEVPPGKRLGVTGDKEGGRLFIMWFFTPYEY